MTKKIIFFGIWLIFLTYGFFFSPADDPETLNLIINLSSGKVEGINPLIVSLFNLMGILPMLYATMLIIDGKGQKINSAPFVVASFFVGAFALLPYFALRESQDNFTGEKTKLIKFLDSRFLAIILSIGAIILLFFGLTNGNFSDFIYQWQNSKFINIMSLDFFCLCLLFPIIIKDDLALRSQENQHNWLWWISFIPLLGALVYLCARPPLKAGYFQSQDQN
ncbi:MAG: DUF2834 domain-containing protein [Cyanobacterium sp. T60_A2020_053]|nr:DUF2834 domain-containing protein [Cyanobacterium sp. T60_A2020_053]